MAEHGTGPQGAADGDDIAILVVRYNGVPTEAAKKKAAETAA